MTKILVNTTASPVTISDVGITVPASGQFTIQPQDFPLFAASNDIVLPIANGTLVVNDGLEDLEIGEGIGLIQGSFINKGFSAPLKTGAGTNDERLKVDIQGNLMTTDGTVKVSSDDTTSDFLGNKLVSAAPFVTLTEINGGANEQLQLGFNQAGILTSAITNDFNFITAGEAPVQSVAGQTGVVILTSTDVGLGNVPNVDATDADNVVVDPISGVSGTDVQAALASLQGNITNVINGTTPVNHNTLTGLQGGQASQYFHLTSAEHATLRGGSADASALHNHDSLYYTQALLDGGQLDSRYFTEAEVTALLAGKQDISEKGVANGYASLDANGLVPTSQLPALAITSTTVVADIPARDALTIGPGAGEIQEGDVVAVIDASGDPGVPSGPASYIYDGAAYVRISTVGGVTTVNGQSGTVVLDTDDISEGSNLYFTDERAQDAVGSILTDSATVDFTYNDAANTITADLTAALNDLSDVVITTPQTDQVIQYNGTNWVNTVLPDGSEFTVNQPGHGFTQLVPLYWIT
jgi:hypothetical protein